MVVCDEDALICDFAESYHIYDYMSLPAEYAATLAVGLRDNSRIKTKLNKMVMPFDDYLLAAIYDDLQLLCWTKTKDAQHGHNKPESVLAKLVENTKPKASKCLVFDSAEMFDEAREKILRGIKDA